MGIIQIYNRIEAKWQSILSIESRYYDGDKRIRHSTLRFNFRIPYMFPKIHAQLHSQSTKTNFALSGFPKFSSLDLNRRKFRFGKNNFHRCINNLPNLCLKYIWEYPNPIRASFFTKAIKVDLAGCLTMALLQKSILNPNLKAF